MLSIAPDEYYVSVLDIDPAHIVRRGYKAVLLDLDNTLLPRGKDELSEDVIQWVESLKDAGLRVAVLSNSTKGRSPRIARSLGLPFIGGAFKPLKHGYLRACAALGVPCRDALMIGDQSYTDVLGAHRMGMDAFMVMPQSSNEPLHTFILRALDRKAVGDLRAQGGRL